MTAQPVLQQSPPATEALAATPVSVPAPAREPSATARDFDYDLLDDGLASGRFAGKPLPGTAALALVHVLRCRSWPLDFRRFAAAMPHLPDHFGAPEIRGVLARLGYRTRVVRRGWWQLHTLPSDAVVVVDADLFLTMSTDARGRRRFVDPRTQDVYAPRRARSYDCIVFDEHDTGDSGVPAQLSWLGTTFMRVGPDIRTILLLTFLSNCLLIVSSLSVGFIFNAVIPARAMDTLAALMLGIAGLFLLDLTLRRIKAGVVARVAGRLEFLVSSALYAKLIGLPLDMLTATSVSSQMTRLKQFESIRELFSGPIVSVALELPFVILLTIAVFLINPVIGWTLLAFVAVYAALGALLYPRIKHANAAVATQAEAYMRLLEETLAERRQILRRRLGESWVRRLTPLHLRHLRARRRVDTYWRILGSVAAVSTPLAVGSVVFIGASQVLSGAMTSGALIACTILSTRLLAPVQQAVMLAVRLPDLTRMIRQIDAMMRLPMPARKTALMRARHVEPRIVLDRVVMRYPKALAPALAGLSLEIEAGSLTCIAGTSGAGKSTLLRGIMGLYRVQSGGIYIGALNVDQLSGYERAHTFGYLGRSPLQIHGTIAQNLRLSAPVAARSEIDALCAELGILEAIEALPDGFDTRLSHQNTALFTPAFRTRLSIAQLLLRRPRVLLLDEPDAALAPRDEAQLLAALARRRPETTCIVVTHRPSTIRSADRVLVLEAGQARFYDMPEKLP